MPIVTSWLTIAEDNTGQLAGQTFLGWIAPEPGLRWLDVGCGNGAFTEMLVEQCAPVSVR